MRTKINSIVIGIILLSLISYANAFAVSAPYMGENKTTNLYPGESKDFEFVLQNGGPDAVAEAIIKANILEGTDIIKITDSSDTYTIPMGENKIVHIRATISKEASIGDSYNVKIGFGTVSKSSSGAFAFGSSIEQSFKVVVVEKSQNQKKEEVNKIIKSFLIILIILILIILIVIIVIKKKKKDSKHLK